MIYQKKAPASLPQAKTETGTESERLVAEAQALSALSIALEGFNLDRIGDLYRSAGESIRTEEGRQKLSEIQKTIYSVLEGYLESVQPNFARIATEDGFSIARAREGALLLMDLYEQFGKINRWPTIFDPLLNRYVETASKGMEILDPKVADFSQELRNEFEDLIQNLLGTFNRLKMQRDRGDAIQKVRNIESTLKDAFEASIDIENAFAWRLGKQVRKLYRYLNREIHGEFGSAIILPEVPMDPTAVIAPRRIPQDW